VKPLTQLPNATALELLPPCAATVVALAEAPSEAVSLRSLSCLWSDPGALLAVLTLPKARESRFLLEHLLSSGTRLADWQTPESASVFSFSQAVALIASQLAEIADEAVEETRAAALLSPLGSLIRVQQGKAYHNAAEDYLLTRRLVRRWKLPEWCSHLLLHLDFPVEPTCADLPENRRLLLVQASIALAQNYLQKALLPFTQQADELLHVLGLDPALCQQIATWLQKLPEPPLAVSTETENFLRRSLRVTVQRENGNDLMLEELEAEVEDLRSQITLQRYQEQEKLQAQKLSALAEFAAGASHEINNPLAVISTQAQHLLKNEESLERAKGLERIIVQANRIHCLLRDLMVYARPPQLNYKSVKIQSLITTAIEKVTEAAVNREVTLEIVKIPPRLKTDADIELLESALVCLLLNGIAAAPSQGWVRLTVTSDSTGQVTFMVEDNGPGISPEARPHLFDPFYSGRTAGRGTGLGLSKVWRIAQLHGGSVDFASHPPQPTRFILRIPAPVSSALPRVAARTTKRK
jgi:two-component system, NtrC family, sensor kinase